MGRGLGLSFGHSMMCVAITDERGVTNPIPDAEGNISTPSLVYVGSGTSEYDPPPENPLIGRRALDRSLDFPSRALGVAPRDMTSHGIVRTANNDWVHYYELAELVMGKLRDQAAAIYGPTKAVTIGVPDYLESEKREAVKMAAIAAGFRDIMIRRESQCFDKAFDLSGASHTGPSRYVLVFDLGATSLSVMLLRVDEMFARVILAHRDESFGADDWTLRLFGLFAREFRRVCGYGPTWPRLSRGESGCWGAGDGRAPLYLEAERVKVELSRNLEARVVDTTIMEAPHLDPQRLSYHIARSEFEEITRDLVVRSRFVVERALQEASLTMDDISEVLCAGGGSNSPAVVGMLREWTQGKVRILPSPEATVAIGAAMLARTSS